MWLLAANVHDLISERTGETTARIHVNNLRQGKSTPNVIATSTTDYTMFTEYKYNMSNSSPTLKSANYQNTVSSE